MLACPAKVLARASFVLAALLAASPAHAQRTAAAQRPPAPAPAAARGPAVPLPPPPAGTSLVARPASRELRVGGLLGLATPRGNGGDGSLMLAADLSVPWRTTQGGLALAWALPFRTILLQSDGERGLKSGGVALELTPGLRASIPLGPKLSFRTDAGAGVVSRFTWVETDVTFVGRRTDTATDVSALVRVGLALDYALRPGVAVAFEPLSFGFDLDGNADWIFAAGATFRL